MRIIYLFYGLIFLSKINKIIYYSIVKIKWFSIRNVFRIKFYSWWKLDEYLKGMNIFYFLENVWRYLMEVDWK